MKNEFEVDLEISRFKEQISFNNTIIKRLTQRNTELRYLIQGIENDFKKKEDKKE